MKNKARPANARFRLRRELLALKTAVLSDALGKTGAMDHDMRCLTSNGVPGRLCDFEFGGHESSRSQERPYPDVLRKIKEHLNAL